VSGATINFKNHSFTPKFLIYKMILTKIKNGTNKSFSNLAFIGLFIILFVLMGIFQSKRESNFGINPINTANCDLSLAAITNVTDTNLTVLYPSNIDRFFVNPANGYGMGGVETLKNETDSARTYEQYPSASYGNVCVVVTFDATGVDVGSMTLFRINWEANAYSTATNTQLLNLSTCILKNGAWELLHNATSTIEPSINRKIGWWECGIANNFGDYVSGNEIKMRFQVEHLLSSSQSSWFLYLLIRWVCEAKRDFHRSCLQRYRICHVGEFI
jgi:hypothetical protein